LKFRIPDAAMILSREIYDDDDDDDDNNNNSNLLNKVLI
jgi:hypothetical protein